MYTSPINTDIDGNLVTITIGIWDSDLERNAGKLHKDVCFLSMYAENATETTTYIALECAALLTNEAFFSGGRYYINSVGQPELLSFQPSLHHVFNWQTKQWEDPRTLSDLKATQWALIKHSRSQAEYAGFAWDGSTFDSDALSQNRITGAVTLAQMSSAFTIDWILADNTVRTLTCADMLQVGAALGAHVAAQFAKGVLLREQIEAAGTQGEIEAVVW